MNKNQLNNLFRKFGFEIHGTGYMQSLKKTSFKEDTFRCQSEILKGKCITIFDVGANRGEMTGSYTSLFPDANIYAFEPFPESANIFNTRFSSNKKIQLFPFALGCSIDKKTFYVNVNADTNSLLKPVKMGLSSDKQVSNISTIDVDVTTISDFCSEKNIDSIDILKLDIQGGELDALKGAAYLLKEKRIKLIYTEAYFRPQYSDQPLYFEIAQYLYQFGYVLQDMYNPIYGKNALAWCDMIFINADCL